MNRFYCENIVGNTIELVGDEASHLINVMRLKAGDQIELFDGKGTLAQAVIAGTKKKSAQLQIENIDTTPPRTEKRVIIAASIAKGQRFDWMISKCTELGTDHIVPIICDRTVKLAKGSKAGDRLSKLALSAAKQCKRLFLPTISQPQKLTEAIGNLKADYPDARLIFGGLTANTVPISSIPTDCDTIAIIGPEGGFTDQEHNFLTENAAIPIKLTDTVLRTETAAVTIASILCTQRDA